MTFEEALSAQSKSQKKKTNNKNLSVVLWVKVSKFRSLYCKWSVDIFFICSYFSVFNIESSIVAVLDLNGPKEVDGFHRPLNDHRAEFIMFSALASKTNLSKVLALLDCNNRVFFKMFG